MRPQLADATLVYLAGRERNRRNLYFTFGSSLWIVTLDRRDFSIDRTSRKLCYGTVPEKNWSCLLQVGSRRSGFD
jgi:hypothetical protein